MKKSSLLLIFAIVLLTTATAQSWSDWKFIQINKPGLALEFRTYYKSSQTFIQFRVWNTTYKDLEQVWLSERTYILKDGGSETAPGHYIFNIPARKTRTTERPDVVNGYATKVYATLNWSAP